MKKQISIILTSLFLSSAVNYNLMARDLIRVKALGASPKGQFVAFEEFGYLGIEGKLPFSKIRILNVWKNKYVEDSIHIVQKGKKLKEVRSQAIKQAFRSLNKFNISI